MLRTISTTAISIAMLVAAAAHAQTRSELVGRIDRFTLSPAGQVDGFVLGSGVEVHFQRYLSPKLTSALERGDLVRTSGFYLTAQHLLLAGSVTDLLNHQTVVDSGANGLPTEAVPEGETDSAEGQVVVVLHDSHGQPDGAILDSGVTVRLPDDVPAILPTLLVVGQALAVRGQRIDTQYGPMVRIESMGPSANELTPLQQPSVTQP